MLSPQLWFRCQRSFSQMHQDTYRAKDKKLGRHFRFRRFGSASFVHNQLKPGPRLLLSAEDAARKTPPPLEIERAMQQDWERSSQLPGVAAGGVTARGWPGASLEGAEFSFDGEDGLDDSWGARRSFGATKSPRPERDAALPLHPSIHQAVDKG